jgi:hypothetical protein
MDQRTDGIDGSCDRIVVVVPSAFDIEFLMWLKISRAIRRPRSGGLKIGGTCYKEPYMCTGTTYFVGQEQKNMERNY